MLGWGSSRSKNLRSPKRDAQTDVQRSEAVLQAVTDALSSIDAETIGLGRRVEELRAWAGGLMGSDDGSNGPRDSRIEGELVEAERQLMQGVQRLRELTTIRNRYCDLQASIAAERERALTARGANG